MLLALQYLLGAVEEYIFALVCCNVTGLLGTSSVGSASPPSLELQCCLARVEENPSAFARFVATGRTGVTFIGSGSPPPLELTCCLARVEECPSALLRIFAVEMSYVTYFGLPLPLVLAYFLAPVKGRLSALVPIDVDATFFGLPPIPCVLGSVCKCLFVLVCGDAVEVKGFGSLALVVLPSLFELRDPRAPCVSNAQLSR